MAVMNKAQVNALFEREAVLLGREDAVPAFRVAALFGADAADYGNKKGNWNGYGVWDYTLMFLSYKGFLDAASFYNVQQLRGEAEKYEQTD